MPRRSGDAHLYRLGHPLAEWAKQRALSRQLPAARLVFDYDGYGTQVSTLKAYRGKSGWLTVKLLTVEALGNQEQQLIVAACTADGIVLEEDDPEKLLRLPAIAPPSSARRESVARGELPSLLIADLASRQQQLLREINQRNLHYFAQEVEKLDAWADDLKLGLEQEIREIDPGSKTSAAPPRPRPPSKKNSRTRNTSASSKASAASFDVNCSLVRIKSEHNAMT